MVSAPFLSARQPIGSSFPFFFNRTARPGRRDSRRSIGGGGGGIHPLIGGRLTRSLIRWRARKKKTTTTTTTEPGKLGRRRTVSPSSVENQRNTPTKNQTQKKREKNNGSRRSLVRQDGVVYRKQRSDLGLRWKEGKKDGRKRSQRTPSDTEKCASNATLDWNPFPQLAHANKLLASGC